MALSTNWPTLIVEISFDNTAWYDTANTWTAVTAYVKSWSFQRGKQRQLNAPQTGTADIVLDNADGRFDPMNASSPYFGSMKPGRMVRMRATFGGVTYGLFKGLVMNWPVSDMGETEPTCALACVDFLGSVFRGSQTDKNPAGNYNGEAIVNWLPAQVNAIAVIDRGSEIMYDVDSTPANLAINGNTTLSTIGVFQLFGDSETESTYFIDGDGLLCYHDHNRRHGVRPLLQATFGNDATANAAGTELPYEAIEVINDDTLIVNSATVAPRDAAIITPGLWDVASVGATDATSIGLIGTRATSRTVATTTSVAGQRIANQLIALYASPTAQIRKLSVDGAQDVAALWPKILGLEIGDPIRIKRRAWPNPTTPLTYDAWIEGVTMSSSLDPLSWAVSWDLSPWVAGYHPPLIGGSGVAFPTSPSSGDMFFRTDLNLLCAYDGTRWLTVNEFSVSTYIQTSAATSIVFSELRQDYLPYVTRVVFGYQVITTNNVTNFWTLDARGINASYGAATSLRSVSTAAAGTSWTNTDAAVGTAPANSARFDLNLTKTGAPGLLTAVPTIYYRLIVT